MSWYKKAKYEDFDRWEELTPEHKENEIDEIFYQSREDANNPKQRFKGLNKRVERPEQTHITWFGNYVLDLDIPIEAVEEIAISGANDEAVDFWHEKVNFGKISDEALRSEVSQHDLSDSNMSSRQNMEKALLWMASHDISEQPERY
ncbi:hypothetical protein CMI47_08640 [Candidatus Pacearchaeota archaeon]|nr:hypothetical protein [Candidatus Pacearchaeota archaeon]|tara:strand:- start:999 stop:1439 length:441 start_codon:yes stop_codon:yes gene_type:complete